MITLTIRWFAMLGALAALLWLCSHSEQANVKGPIPLTNIVSCIFVSAIAAMLCKRYWLTFASVNAGQEVQRLSVRNGCGNWLARSISSV